MLRNILRLGCLLSLAPALLARPSSAVETLGSQDVLVVEFTLTPPYECGGGVPCTPDVLNFSSGQVLVRQTISERRARLYVDDVLLGSWIGPGSNPTPVFVGPGLDGLWKDAASPYTLSKPTPIDFAPILAGSTNARIELRLGTGRQEYMDGFPRLSVLLRMATDMDSTVGIVNGPVVTSVQIVPDPERFSVVDSTAADPDDVPGDGVCATALAECTLPAAVEEANAFPGPNTVTVPAGSYPGGLTLSGSVSIEGAGSAATVIDGGGAGSVLTVTGGTVGLDRLAVTGGSSAGNGGGIDLQGGSLSLIEAEVHGNGAAGDGGGVHQGSGTDLFVLLSAIRDNTAGGDGGGIFATGFFQDLDVIESSIHHNTATAGDGGGIHSSVDFLLLDAVKLHDNEAQRGGGLVSDDFFAFVVESHVYGNMAGDWAGGAVFLGEELVLDASTFDGNQGGAGGGALRLASGVSAELVNSTFSGNSGQLGGGILLESPFTASLKSLTLTANQAGRGGGLLLSSSSGAGSLELDDTILAGNLATGSGPDCTSSGGLKTLTSLGHNLVGDGAGCAFPATTGDQVGSALAPIDPMLAPLAMLDPLLPPVRDPLPGSPAIDRGSPEAPDSSPSACPPEDQLFLPRPFDGDGDGVARCDIGAVEKGSMPVPGLGPAGLLALSAILATAGAGVARRWRSGSPA